MITYTAYIGLLSLASFFGRSLGDTGRKVLLPSRYVQLPTVIRRVLVTNTKTKLFSMTQTRLLV